MHTKEKLAEALQAAGLRDMAEYARIGYYHDYESPLAFPVTQLLHDLRRVNTPAAAALMTRVRHGEFDATEEEAEAWANSPEAQKGLARLDSGWVEVARPKRPPEL